MVDAFERLTLIDMKAMFLSLLIIFTFALLLLKAVQEFCDIFGWTVFWKKKDQKLDEIRDMVKDLTNRVHRDEKEIEGIYECKDKFEQQLISITKHIEEQKEETQKLERTKLKENITKAHRHYHKTKQWNYMEKEAFEDMIEEYSKKGGNSYVHKVIEPESKTWEVVPFE